MNPLLLPMVAAQALWVRATVVPAAEPTGPPTGTVAGDGGPPLRIGVVGESTAAGCGVTRHDEGFAASLAGHLAARTGRPVRWETVGRYGATAGRIRHRLAPLLGADLNLVVLLAGVNDVLARHSPDRWRDGLSGILTDLAGRADHVVVAGIPPFTLFPSLPPALARYLAERADALNATTRQVCAVNPEITTFAAYTEGEPPPGFFAADRFHPSATGYHHWAATVADALTV